MIFAEGPFAKGRRISVIRSEEAVSSFKYYIKEEVKIWNMAFCYPAPTLTL